MWFRQDPKQTNNSWQCKHKTLINLHNCTMWWKSVRSAAGSPKGVAHSHLEQDKIPLTLVYHKANETIRPWWSGGSVFWRVFIGNQPKVWWSPAKGTQVNPPHPLVREPGKQNANKSTNTQNMTVLFYNRVSRFFPPLIWLSRTSWIINSSKSPDIKSYIGCKAVVRRIFLTWKGTHFHNLAPCHLHKDCSVRRYYTLERWPSKKILKWIPTISKPLTLLFYPFWNLFIHILYKPLTGSELFLHSIYLFVLSLLVNLAQIPIHLVDPGPDFCIGPGVAWQEKNVLLSQIQMLVLSCWWFLVFMGVCWCRLPNQR